MSRSYRRNPVLTDNGTSKEYKVIANRIVRAKLKTGKYDDIGIGLTGHRKLFESWDIHDYRFRKDYSDLKRDTSKSSESPAEVWAKYKKDWLSK